MSGGSLHLVMRNYGHKNLVLQVVMLFLVSSLAEKGYGNG